MNGIPVADSTSTHYFPLCVSLLPAILWDRLAQASLLLPLLDVPSFRKAGSPRAQPAWE